MSSSPKDIWCRFFFSPHTVNIVTPVADNTLVISLRMEREKP